MITPIMIAENEKLAKSKRQVVNMRYLVLKSINEYFLAAGNWPVDKTLADMNGTTIHRIRCHLHKLRTIDDAVKKDGRRYLVTKAGALLLSGMGMGAEQPAK